MNLLRPFHPVLGFSLWATTAVAVVVMVKVAVAAAVAVAMMKVALIN